MKRCSLLQATAQLAGSAMGAKIDDLFTQNDLIQRDEPNARGALRTLGQRLYNPVLVGTQ